MKEKTTGKPELANLLIIDHLIIDFKIPEDVAYKLKKDCPNLSINSKVISGITGDTLRYDALELSLIPYSKDLAFAYDNRRDILFIKKL